jgi:hypothetical protein
MEQQTHYMKEIFNVKIQRLQHRGLCDSAWVKIDASNNRGSGAVVVARKAVSLLNEVSFSYIADETEGCNLLVHVKLYTFFVSLFTEVQFLRMYAIAKTLTCLPMCKSTFLGIWTPNSFERSL